MEALWSRLLDVTCSKGAAALGVAGALPAARPALAQTTQKRELVVAQGGDIAFFDPHLSTSSNDIRVSFNLFDNLDEPASRTASSTPASPPSGSSRRRPRGRSRSARA